MLEQMLALGMCATAHRRRPENSSWASTAFVAVTESALSEAATRLAVAQGELVEMARRLGSVEAKVQGLEALLTEVRASRDAAQEHLRTTQDQLRQALAAVPKPTVRRSWWPWTRSA